MLVIIWTDAKSIHFLLSTNKFPQSIWNRLPFILKCSDGTILYVCLPWICKGKINPFWGITIYISWAAWWIPNSIQYQFSTSRRSCEDEDK